MLAVDVGSVPPRGRRYFDIISKVIVSGATSPHNTWPGFLAATRRGLLLAPLLAALPAALIDEVL